MHIHWEYSHRYIWIQKYRDYIRIGSDVEGPLPLWFTDKIDYKVCGRRGRVFKGFKYE